MRNQLLPQQLIRAEVKEPSPRENPHAPDAGFERFSLVFAGPRANGLPQENCYVNVLRDATSVDTLDGCGVYFGTSAGQVYASRDGGDHWAPIVSNLPAIVSVEAQTLQHRFGPKAEAVLTRCASLTLDDLAQTSPLLDLWQGAQDRLYSRLFQS